MTCRSLLFVSAISFVATHASAQQWQDGRTFDIEGRGWIDTAGPFDRLPDSARAKVNETAWTLGKHSAGVAIRFMTDAPNVSVRWSVTNASLAMPHMPATGCSGVDLYARQADGTWRFVGNGRPHKQDGNESTIDFEGDATASRECLLYLPLYNGTKSVELRVPAGKTLAKPAARATPLPIAVYGTSITQGGCASRPGMAWPAILGRLLDRPVINLGFSSSGDMAAPVGDVLAELDVAAYVIDCTWNMGTGREMFADHVTKLVRSIRAKHPQTPIYFLGQSHFRPEAHPTERTRDQLLAIEQLQRDGVPNLFAIDPVDAIGTDGEATVDGVHFTDIGMQRQAQSLAKVLRHLKADGVAKERP